MLCSFLIPTRFRFDSTLRLINSIYESSIERDFEIILRFHGDDRESLDRVGELMPFTEVRFIAGQTLDGYNSLHIFAAELLDVANGEWTWHLNSDMVLQGRGWEDQLREIPREALVHPETHRLNDSEYPNHVSGPAPCHTNQKWIADYLRTTDYRIDTNLYNEFVRRDRPIRFLKGMTVFHDWHGHADTLPK